MTSKIAKFHQRGLKATVCAFGNHYFTESQKGRFVSATKLGPCDPERCPAASRDTVWIDVDGLDLHEQELVGVPKVVVPHKTVVVVPICNVQLRSPSPWYVEPVRGYSVRVAGEDVYPAALREKYYVLSPGQETVVYLEAEELEDWPFGEFKRVRNIDGDYEIEPTNEYEHEAAVADFRRRQAEDRLKALGIPPQEATGLLARYHADDIDAGMAVWEFVKAADFRLCSGSWALFLQTPETLEIMAASIDRMYYSMEYEGELTQQLTIGGRRFVCDLFHTGHLDQSLFFKA